MLFVRGVGVVDRAERGGVVGRTTIVACSPSFPPSAALSRGRHAVCPHREWLQARSREDRCQSLWLN